MCVAQESYLYLNGSNILDLEKYFFNESIKVLFYLNFIYHLWLLLFSQDHLTPLATKLSTLHAWVSLASSVSYFWGISAMRPKRKRRLNKHLNSHSQDVFILPILILIRCIHAIDVLLSIFMLILEKFKYWKTGRWCQWNLTTKIFKMYHYSKLLQYFLNYTYYLCLLSH